MRNLINKNIIKAMTIGISAVMTFGSFNLAAFAAESEGNPNTQPVNEGTDAIDQGTKEAVTAADAKDTTETALQTIGASVGSIEEAVKAADEFKEGVSDLISDKQKESDTYQNIIEAAETLEEELTDDYGVEKDGSKDSSENTSDEADDDGKPAGDTQGEASEGDVAPTEESQGNTSSDDNKPVEETQGTASDGGIAPAGETVVDEKDADVIEYLEDVRDDLDAAAKVDAEIDARVTEANGYIDDANAIVESKELAELNEQINAFIEKIGTKTEEDTTLIESLEKRGEAVGGYASAVKQATEKEVAEQAVEEARGQKDSAVGEYEDAAEELEKLEAAVTAAKANYDDAVGKYNDVKAELDAKLAEYNSLVEQAKESAGEADEEIERLKAEAKALSNAVTEAKDSYNTTGYELIAALEKDIQNNESKQTFLNRSELVKNIMQFYYVPDVLGGTFGEWKSNWYNAPGGDWYDNGVNTNSNGNVLNYGHFTYTDAEGNPQEMYINYKTADGNTEKSKRGVIIFEETEHLVIGNEEKCRDITEDMMDKLDKDGLYVDEEAGFVYVKKDDGSIVRYDTTQGGEFQNGAFNQNQIDDDSNYSVVSEEDIANIPADVSLTDVYINKNTENVSYSFENGKLTKTVTADVTITKYVGTTGSVSMEETSTETKELYKLVFSKVADTARTEYRNDNWYTGNILLAEFENETYTTDGNGGGDYTYTNPEQKPISVTDKTVKANNSDFRSKIDNCAKVTAKYAALADKAVAAQTAVNFAAGKVKELEAQLNKLGKEADLKELKEFTAKQKLSDAKQKLSDAEAIKDSIVSKFDTLEKEFQEKDWEAVNDNNGNGNGTNNGGTTDDGTNDDGGNGTNDDDSNGTNDDDGNGTNDSGTTDDGTNDDGGNGNGNGTDDGDDNGDDNGSGTETEPEPEANEENVNGGESGSDNGTTDNGTTDNGTTDNGAADNGNADGGNANAEGGKGNGEQTETIGDEDSALAGDIGGAADNAGIGTVNIGDDDSALAGTIQTKRKWNWWWLLIVAAVTGGTTFGIAKGNQKKKEQADNGSDNN